MNTSISISVVVDRDSACVCLTLFLLRYNEHPWFKKISSPSVNSQENISYT